MRLAARFFGFVIGALAGLTILLGYVWGPGAQAAERVAGWFLVAGALLYGLSCLPRRARAWWRSTDPWDVQTRERWR